MSIKKANILWAVSLVLIGIATILLAVLAGLKFKDILFPDIVIRILGISELIGLSLLFFSTAKKLQNKA